jgi:hypothetical protein
MMYADLVDMDDFVKALNDVGVACASRDANGVKTEIAHWLKNGDSKSRDCFWDVLRRIETEGILLPDVENIISWTHKQFIPFEVII